MVTGESYPWRATKTAQQRRLGCFGDSRRGKGKRGGLRVIYYFWTGGPEFWLFTLYDKDEMDDMTPKQREALKARVKGELKMRRNHP
jgi:hypothetical protein